MGWRDGGDITVNAASSAQVTVTQQLDGGGQRVERGLGLPPGVGHDRDRRAAHLHTQAAEQRQATHHTERLRHRRKN